MIARLPSWADNLRVRIGVLLFAGVLMAGLGFHALLLTLTRQRLLQELDVRSRGVATLLATRLGTPLLLHDRAELRRQLELATQERDVVGIAVHEADGAEFERVVRVPSRWIPGSRIPAPSRAGSPQARTRTIEPQRLREISVAIRREGAGRSGVEDAMSEVLGSMHGGEPAPEHAGWVRILYDTSPVDEAVRDASRLGFTILLGALLIWLVPLFGLLRFIARPLREASALARAIAAGQLERRLPVRSDDELGTLAASLNTMAVALTDAQRRARGEADSMARATGAMIAIARGARVAHGVGDVFEVVADQLRRVTESQGAALCLPDADGPLSVFTRFAPPLPWGELAPGLPLDPELARRLSATPDQPVRIDVEHDDTPITRGLRRDGFRSALLVPLADQLGAVQALLLASTDPDAYPPAQVEVVMGLASHLVSALGATFLHDQLQQAVTELEQTRERLERSERMRMAGEMASGVAHDFNNVLGAILGRAQLLRRRARGGELGGAELDRALEIIERAAQDGGDTVRRLRQFGAGQRSEDAEVVDLDAMMRDAAEYVRPRWQDEAQAQGRAIEVRFVSVPGATVRGRASEMREVFTNLVVNATDALPAGGTITLSTRVEQDRVVAIVEDDGVGMPEPVRKRIFDPFFTTKGDGGTGLGLSVVYGIVKSWDGEVAVNSAPGRGTRMELSFPRALPEPASDATPSWAEPPPGELHVMVVDDEPEVRNLLLDILRSLGQEPVGFGSGGEALEAYQPGQFDLVFTDLGMPGMTGWELAHALRARDEVVPIAIITGWGADVGPEALEEAGADAVVSKPFTIEDIEGLVRLARERREKRAA